MNFKIFWKSIPFYFLILSGFSFWGCATLSTLPKEKNVPINGEAGRVMVHRKFPVQAALLISEEERNYVYKVTPMIMLIANVVHVFPLGDAWEKDSIQVFSQIFRDVQVVRTPAEAQKFKIVIAPVVSQRCNRRIS
jgi:hypothetical protein